MNRSIHLYQRDSIPTFFTFQYHVTKWMYIYIKLIRRDTLLKIRTPIRPGKWQKWWATSTSDAQTNFLDSISSSNKEEKAGTIVSDSVLSQYTSQHVTPGQLKWEDYFALNSNKKNDHAEPLFIVVDLQSKRIKICVYRIRLVRTMDGQIASM